MCTRGGSYFEVESHAICMSSIGVLFVPNPIGAYVANSSTIDRLAQVKEKSEGSQKGPTISEFLVLIRMIGTLIRDP